MIVRYVLYIVAVIQGLFWLGFMSLALKFAFEQQWPSVAFSLLAAIVVMLFRVAHPENYE